MTRVRKPHRKVAAAFLVGGAVLAACSTPSPPSATARAHTEDVVAGMEIVQLGFGPQASFALCRGSDCPVRTPKTLASVPAPEAVPAPSTGPVAAPQLAPAAPIRLVVRFAVDSARLDARARRDLDRVLARVDDATEVLIQGRTDATGPRRHNAGLARRRALAVQTYLLKKRADLAERVSLEARGACCYVANNATSEGRARNRRAVVKVRPPAATPADPNPPN